MSGLRTAGGGGGAAPHCIAASNGVDERVRVCVCVCVCVCAAGAKEVVIDADEIEAIPASSTLTHCEGLGSVSDMVSGTGDAPLLTGAEPDGTPGNGCAFGNVGNVGNVGALSDVGRGDANESSPAAFGGRIAGSGLAMSRTWLRFMPLAKKLYAPIA